MPKNWTARINRGFQEFVTKEFGFSFVIQSDVIHAVNILINDVFADLRFEKLQ